MVWYPLGFIFIGLNNAMKKGKLGGLEQKAHDRVQSFNKVSTTPVYAAQSRPVYEQDAQTPNAASAKPQMQGKKGKNAWLATGLTVAGVVAAAGYGRRAALAGGWRRGCLSTRWPRATITGAGCCPPGWSRIRCRRDDGGIGCLFGAQHIRTSRRMRKKIDNIVGDAKYMYIQDIADAIPCSYEKCCKYLESCIDEGCSARAPFWTCAANAWW